MNKLKTALKYLKIAGFLFILLCVYMNSAFTHKFGPYHGKVVDAQNGEPIEGAVVLVGFHTKGGSVGGWVHHFLDAVEVITNEKGEFRIPAQRYTGFKFMRIWDKQCDALIFSPGYGAYPGHKVSYSEPEYNPSWTLLENTHVTFYLPKLLTRKERKDNLHNVTYPAGTPIDLMPNLKRLENKERVYVGL